MADVQAAIDWLVNTALQVFNVIKQAGIYFYVWIAAVFVLPNFNRLLRALRGGR